MADHGRPAWAGRLDQLRQSLAERALDALVVSTSVNITYLTGFVGSAGLLVLTPGATFLIADGRYAGAVHEGVQKGTVVSVRIEPVPERYDLSLAHLVSREGLRRVGFEAANITVATLGSWQRAAPGVEWVATELLVETQRLIKDDLEIAILRRGGRLIAGVAERLRECVVRGRTEREVADAIERLLFSSGFERIAFPTIVASGPNSAHPHARPTGRRLSEGDLVVLDFGGVLDGYCVDLTRMAAVGHIAPAAHALVTGVLAANAAAIATVRPGISTAEVDRAARAVLEACGLGEAFVHSTGHGLGLEVHEAPRIARSTPATPGGPVGNGDQVVAGMVFTIEPGAYVDGTGGVRVEDDVLVTAQGCEVLTDVSRELLVV